MRTLKQRLIKLEARISGRVWGLSDPLRDWLDEMAARRSTGELSREGLVEEVRAEGWPDFPND